MIKKTKLVVMVMLVIGIVGMCFAGCSMEAPGAADDTAEATEQAEETAAAEETAGDAADEPQEDSGSGSGKPGEGLKIGMTTVTLSMSFFVDVENAAVAAVEEWGAEAITNSADVDPAKQTAAIEDFITMGVDGILVLGVDPAAVVPAVEEAVAAGIPVLQADMVLETDKTICFVGSDNYGGGAMLGKYMKEYIEANYPADEEVTIGSVIWMESNIQQMRLEGFTEEVTKLDNVKILEPQPGYDSEESMISAENIMQANPDVDFIYATSVNSTGGTIAAVESSGKDNVFAIGFDMSTEAESGIRNGSALAIIDQQPSNIGKTAIDILMEYVVNGVDPESDEILTETKLYDAANIDEWVLQ